MRPLAAGVVPLCWLALTVGCSVDTRSDTSATAPTSPSATSAVPTGQSPAARPLADLADAPALAPGQGLTTPVRLPHRLAGGVRWHTEAVTPAGELVIDVALPAEPRPTGELVLHQSRLALLDPKTSQVTYLPDQGRRRPATQVVGVDTTRRWVVWVETPSTNVYEQSWVLYAHDRRTDVTRRLATDPSVSTSPPPPVPGGTVPSIAGGRAYVSAVAALRGRQVVPGVFSVDLTGHGRLRPEAQGAYHSGAGHGSLVFVRGLDQGWSIIERDLRSGVERVVGGSLDGERLAGMASDGRTTTWATSSGRRRLLYASAPSARATSPVIDDVRPLGYLRVVGAHVAFCVPAPRVGYVAYLWDPAREELRRLTGPALAGSPAGDRYMLAWAPVTADGSSPTELVASLSRGDRSQDPTPG